MDWSAPGGDRRTRRRGTSCWRPTCCTRRATASALLPLLPRLIDARGEIWLADPGRREAQPFLERAAEVFAIETRARQEIPQGAIHRMRLKGSGA